MGYAAAVPVPPGSTWSLSSLKLPKAIESDPRAPAVEAGLRAKARRLWDGGALDVPVARWTPGLALTLEGAHREGSLVRGLELVEKTLEREARGLSIADARSGAARGSRLSRLLLVSNDGTERFYRQVERLLVAQGPRLLAIRIDVDSDRFAVVVPEASGVVRALLLEHKELVASALLALYAPA